MQTPRRILQIVYVAATAILAHCFEAACKRLAFFKFAIWWSPLTGPKRLKTCLEQLGGSFVKFGQLLALQPDILPMEYCEELYNLLDRVKPIPFDQMQGVFREEIDKDVFEVFDQFDSDSIASGSIGQVYKAVYRGHQVAVKIQRPDTISGFERDIRLMKTVAWLIETFNLKPVEWMVPPLTEFAEWTLEELDFRIEARYMQQMRQNSKHNDNERIPGIVYRLTKKRILVIEFLDGVTLLDHMRKSNSKDRVHDAFLQDIDFDADEFAINIIDNFLGDSFNHGVFHSDLHPANLMILGKESRKNQNSVGYLDFGIVGVISPFSRKNLVSITLAYARRDLESLCESFFEVSSMTKESRPDLFRTGIQELAQRWYQGSEDDPKLKTTTTIVMLDMLKLSRKAKIWPQRDVIKYIRSAIAIDGLIRQFAPQFDVGTHLANSCKRHLASHARQQMFSHDSLINWASSTTELAKTGAFRVGALFQSLADNNQHVQRKSSQSSLTPYLLVFGLGAFLLITPSTENALPLLCLLLAAFVLVRRSTNSGDFNRVHHSSH